MFLHCFLLLLKDEERRGEEEIVWNFNHGNNHRQQGVNISITKPKREATTILSNFMLYAFIIWDQSHFISFQDNTSIKLFYAFFLPGLYFPLTQASLNHCHDRVTLKYIQAKCGHGDLEEVTKTLFTKTKKAKIKPRDFLTTRISKIEAIYPYIY